MNCKMSERYHKTTGCYPYSVTVEAIPIGEDMVVTFYGGTKPHIGAVAVAIPRSSLKDPSTVSATTSVFAFVGHKEDELAKTSAQKISSTLNKKVVLTMGIHVDDIAEEGIRAIEHACRNLIEDVIDFYVH